MVNFDPSPTSHFCLESTDSRTWRTLRISFLYLSIAEGSFSEWNIENHAACPKYGYNGLARTNFGRGQWNSRLDHLLGRRAKC